MRTYNISGDVRIHFDFLVEEDSYEEARREGFEMVQRELSDIVRYNSVICYHDNIDSDDISVEDVTYDLRYEESN